MHGPPLIYFICLIFTGAAILATLTLYSRQSLLVAYILVGILIGPSGFKLVPDLAFARQFGDIGIVFLLFLLGLELNPKELLRTLSKTTIVTCISSIVFAGLGICIGALFNFTWLECIIIGTALMFSSTIVGLKLLPPVVLHRKKPVGELMISILLLQDLIAIATMIFLNDTSMTGSRIMDIGLAAITLPALLGFAFLLQTYVIEKLFFRFEKVKEYTFLLALGWCLGLAELAELIGLPGEIGAFIAGISIAEGTHAEDIFNHLKPLRDFGLVLFFFAIGASFNINYLSEILPVALLLAILTLCAKPLVFSFLLQQSGIIKKVAREVGFRLGQNSEFSLLLAYVAMDIKPAIISQKVENLIEAATIITFIISSYLVVLRYPTPVAEKMQAE